MDTLTMVTSHPNRLLITKTLLALEENAQQKCTQFSPVWSANGLGSRELEAESSRLWAVLEGLLQTDTTVQTITR